MVLKHSVLKDNDLSHKRTYLRPRSGWSSVDLKSLWETRDLLWMLAWRDIQVQYKQTFFGFAWAIIVPFVQIVVFTIFFGKLLGVGDKIDEVAERQIPYPLFALSGQVIWNCFSSGVTGASNGLLANAAIVRKVYVPRLALPLAGLGKPTLDALIASVFLYVLAAWYAGVPDNDVWLSYKLPLTIIFLAASLIPALAMGMIFAAITVFYRDLKLVLPFLLQILFYATPVIYPAELVPDQYRWLLFVNPAGGFVSAHRACVLDLPINWLGVILSMVVSVALLIFGTLFFTRAERHFADVA